MNKPMLSAMLSFESHYLNDDEKCLFKKYNPIGFNLFSRNIESKEQLKKTIKEIKEVLERDDVLFAIDQEGGRVRRLREPEFRTYLSQNAFGDIYKEAGKETAKEMSNYHAYLISSDLKEIGFNMNYAPVLDIAQEYTSPVLKSRCISNDKEIVAELGKIMLQTYIKNAVCPCIKHVPGHGRARVDPHLNLPIIKDSLKELEQDFYPFIKNNNSPAAMTAHIVIPEIDDKLPITQSKKAIDSLIRGKLGIKGLLISDAIDMKALKGNIGEKAEASLKAGCDIICYALGNYKELVEICEHCSIMNEDSILRFGKIKDIISKNPSFDEVDIISNRYLKKAGGIELYSDEYDATEVLNKMARR